MARYTGPDCKLCRREGMKLYLKGERCLTKKCAIERRPYPPGQAGQGPPAQTVRICATASRKAEGPPHLWRARRTISTSVPGSRAPVRHDR